METIKKLILCMAMLVLSTTLVQAEHLVFVAVNDTHSQIDPASDGKGGVARRRAIYDQLRRDNPHVVTLHAGDAVQGTMFFNLYGGEVEYALIDSLGYDMIILGNHEFDNGIDSVAHFYRNIKAQKLSANYDMSGTPLEGLFTPYAIKAVGDKRVGVFGINTTPVGLISPNNYGSMRYINSQQVADATARYLKEVIGCDYAVMLSHIGYMGYTPGEPTDTSIIARSHYIDLVIGGHSHTVVKPGTSFATINNADGKPIVVGQNGKSGKFVGVYDLDLDNGHIDYRQISVDTTWDEAASRYTAMNAWLDKYRHGVDSLMQVPAGHCARYMSNHSQAAQNWVADATMAVIPRVSGLNDVQLAIMNKGGIRNDFEKGEITKGQVMSIFPFDNRFVVVDITGQDLLDAIKVMVDRGGDSVSKELQVTYDSKGNVTSAKVSGKKVDPKKTYRVATVDYLANGGDNMFALGRGKRVYVDEQHYGDYMLEYVIELERQGKMIDASDAPRLIKK